MSEQVPDTNPNDVVVPVVQEEVHADAIPVITGGIRVTKHVETHNELIEQQLRTSRAEVKRVKTDRIVDGPQPARREGNVLIIPVVSEVIHVQKQWVVTEEIHIAQREQTETVRQTVPVNYERAEVERVDDSGNVESLEQTPELNETSSRSIVNRRPTVKERRKPLTRTKSLLKER
jgi:stress response protein YsnF